MKQVPRGRISLRRQASKDAAVDKTVSLDGRRIKPSSCDGQVRLGIWSHCLRELGQKVDSFAPGGSLNGVAIV